MLGAGCAVADGSERSRAAEAGGSECNRAAWRQLVIASATSQKRSAKNVLRYVHAASLDIQLNAVGTDNVAEVLAVSWKGAAMAHQDRLRVVAVLERALCGRAIPKPATGYGNLAKAALNSVMCDFAAGVPHDHAISHAGMATMSSAVAKQLSTAVATCATASVKPTVTAPQRPAAKLAWPKVAARQASQCWKVHPGWRLRRGKGLVTWVFTSPDGTEFTSEPEAQAEAAKLRRGTLVGIERTWDRDKAQTHTELPPSKTESSQPRSFITTQPSRKHRRSDADVTGPAIDRPTTKHNRHQKLVLKRPRPITQSKPPAAAASAAVASVASAARATVARSPTVAPTCDSAANEEVSPLPLAPPTFFQQDPQVLWLPPKFSTNPQGAIATGNVTTQNTSERAAYEAGYRPWLSVEERPTLSPLQNTSVANAKVIALHLRVAPIRKLSMRLMLLKVPTASVAVRCGVVDLCCTCRGRSSHHAIGVQCAAVRLHLREHTRAQNPKRLCACRGR